MGHHTEAFVGIDAEPGCPGDEQVLVAVDPVAADGESSEDAAIDAAWCAQVDVFHARNRGKEVGTYDWVDVQARGPISLHIHYHDSGGWAL